MPICAGGDLCKRGRADIIATTSQFFWNSPKQSRKNRIGFFIHILSVEGKARLDAQTVASAKADPFNMWVLQQRSGKIFGFLRGQSDFKSVFSGIA